MDKFYFLTKGGKWMQSMMTLVNYGGTMEWMSFSVASIDKPLFEELIGNQKYYVLQQDVAIKGFRSFGEIRDHVKVYKADLAEDKVAYYNSAMGDADDVELEFASQENPVTAVKVEMPLDDNRIQCIIEAMKMVAKAVIEEEFDKRLQKLDMGNHLEEMTFQFQYEEALKYKADDKADVPLLSAVAEARDLTKGEMADRIISARDSYRSRITNLFKKMTEVKQIFKSCSTIVELNRAYEDYFNIAMKEQQAVAEGRIVIDPETGDGTRIKPLGIGLNF